jgi:hypothetical protein
MNILTLTRKFHQAGTNFQQYILTPAHTHIECDEGSQRRTLSYLNKHLLDLVCTEDCREHRFGFRPKNATWLALGLPRIAKEDVHCTDLYQA